MKTIQKMYEHLNWANQLILETLQSIEDKNQEVSRLFSHILLAEKVWITRLRGLDSSRLPIWSEVDIEVCAELVMHNKESLTTFLTNSSNTDLDKLISYTNSKGKEFKNSVRDILTHVALHGQYHRGQINSRLRSDGFEPANIDFITFVR
ncbi:DinB family protein [Peribacillus butanolivorans]|uniref:DinB family protein n=1 Tax=Peribacillus TaxID=2675229 RepID=UPI001914984D|nr:MULTISPECIES: DinB family protein [unclassified Peribacillus]MBK5445024.1 DinB family protein [Peribacillus sp. TH24]MBK5460256.1 DinB family protein [Peribacillus sp. TH27]WMX56454.1 DinB family protein [Peribacillus sp. R9-11]